MFVLLRPRTGTLGLGLDAQACAPPPPPPPSLPLSVSVSLIYQGLKSDRTRFIAAHSHVLQPWEQPSWMTWGAGVPQRPPVTPRQVLRQGRFPPGTPRLEPRLEFSSARSPDQGHSRGRQG